MALQMPQRSPIATPQDFATTEWQRFFQDVLVRLDQAEARIAALEAGLPPTAAGASGTVWRDGAVWRVVP